MTMNLRNITIWTTGLALIGTMIIPAMFLFHVDDAAGFGLVLLIWCLSGSPIYISFRISMRLKYTVSIVILLVSTIVYVSSYVFMVVGLQALFGFGFFIIGIFLLPVMIPVWIIAYALNRRCAKQEPQV